MNAVRTVVGLTHFAGTVGVLGTLTTFVHRFDNPFGPHDFSPFPYDVYWAGPLVLLVVLAVPLAWWVSRARSPVVLSLVGGVFVLRADAELGAFIMEWGSLHHRHEPMLLWVNPLSLLTDVPTAVVVCAMGAAVLGLPPFLGLPARLAKQCTGVEVFERVCFRAAAVLGVGSALVLPLSMARGPCLPVVSLAVAAVLAALGLWQRQLRRRVLAAR